MIQYDKDGVTLFFIDANGNKVSANPFDGKKWSDLDTILLNQIEAGKENELAVNTYNGRLAFAQSQANSFAPYTAPPKPLMHVISEHLDAASSTYVGFSTYVPFSPALADIMQPPAPATSTVSGLVNTAIPAPVDTQAVMYAMITAIYRKMFPGA